MSSSFDFLEHELRSDLLFEQGVTGGEPQLRRVDGKPMLPGQPWIDMTTGDLLPFFRKSFLIEALDKAAPYLWLVSTPTETNVYPMHHQIVRGRSIVVTEEPGLHLVWHYDKIFIKPIPKFLLCAAFWRYIYDQDRAVWKAAAGFMRTYCYMIRNESDFNLAISDSMALIPRGLDQAQKLTFETFVPFVAQFENLKNCEVAPRYSYGMLRLTRINHMAFFFMGKLTYFHIQPQWVDYLGNFISPILTTFAVMSTILGSMQVGLASQSLDGGMVWPQFVAVCEWTAVAVLILVAAIFIALLGFFLSMMLKELVFARSFIRAKRLSVVKESQAVV
ncbi:hypothetical protein GJ744_001909 [Endocarpon pusillum]|uniref:Subtilisin-like serine protease n=1 Tax=Endocarpon pusillum TaxID=364733 RepID=A0A8H7ASG2_9EURO|nr:hypothetical protein GJ744_001909 [Endocarpon pusillum]